jgi:rod shape-determining protein MreC
VELQVREHRYLVLVVLGTFFLVLLNLPDSVSGFLRSIFREGIASYQQAGTRVVSKLSQTEESAGSYEEVLWERNRLLEEVVDLRAKARVSEQINRENEELRSLVGFRKSSGYRTIACEVIARDDGYGWWQTIRLNKGRANGISENMAVITPDGVVGKTIEVSDSACDVLLISDRNFRVSVRFEEEGSFGVLHGGGVSLRGGHSLGVVCLPVPFQVEFVRKDLALKTGELVTTSGLGGVFPPGLIVGRVVAQAPDETGLYQRVVVTPTADMARLRKVLVVTD